MDDNESTDLTITISDSSEGGVCPFSHGRLKKAGDALVFFMLFVVPFLYLVVFLITR
ncbi:MAG: hypothetical protein ACFFF9_11320 [Candidatus Thorarchaeota archaeon]